MRRIASTIATCRASVTRLDQSDKSAPDVEFARSQAEQRIGGIDGSMITVHGWDISQQMVMTGAVIGLSYSAIAAGLILVYRANGIIRCA